MKYVMLAMTIFLGTFATPADNRDEPLPELHKIKQITLAPSYSCRSEEDFQKGYQHTALFLSTSFYGPDLLFNGACGAPDYVESTDLSVIADLGKVMLEDLAAVHAFNLKRIAAPQYNSRFVRQMPVELGHTYAVLLNTPDARGIFYFTITGYIPNERLDLRYAVKEYQLLSVRAQSPGFDWDRKSN